MFGIIVQARLTGKRFPNKILCKLGGKMILDHVIDNLKDIPDSVLVFAIPETMENDYLVDLLDVRDIPYSRGPEVDVLGRFWKCCEEFSFNTIVRVCCDTPFINQEDIMEQLERFERKGFSYGNGCWIFSRKDLEEAERNQVHAKSREHVVRSMFNSVDYRDDITRLEKKFFTV